MTVWRRFVHYFCRSCEEPCINDFRTSRARYKECYSCHSVPSLEDNDPDNLDVDLDVDLDELPHPEASGPDYPPTAPAVPATSRGQASASERNTRLGASASEREYGVSCASERFPQLTDGGYDG